MMLVTIETIDNFLCMNVDHSVVEEDVEAWHKSMKIVSQTRAARDL